MDAAAARRLWPLIEPIHAVVYFTAEVTAAASSAGIERQHRYFALRAAPMGPVAGEVVTAVFYGFAPGRVAEALPAVWQNVDPSTALAARDEGASAAISRLLVGGDQARLRRAAELARAAAEQVGSTAGRPLTAANVPLLDLPATVEGRLWQAMTVLREHRGEGHSIALAHAEVGPVQAHVLRAAAGEADLDFLQRSRGWSDGAVATARSDLERRGWLDGTGALSTAGRSARLEYEAATDRLAAAPWRRIGVDRTTELAALLLPIAERVVSGCADAMRVGLGSPWPAHAA